MPTPVAILVAIGYLSAKPLVAVFAYSASVGYKCCVSFTTCSTTSGFIVSSILSMSNGLTYFSGLSEYASGKLESSLLVNARTFPVASVFIHFLVTSS